MKNGVFWVVTPCGNPEDTILQANRCSVNVQFSQMFLESDSLSQEASDLDKCGSHLLILHVGGISCFVSCSYRPLGLHRFLRG
jgi:hypothetical protein